MFKVNQKVVFIGLIEGSYWDSNFPKINEVVTISGISHDGHYSLKGYEESTCKKFWRWFFKEELRPIDYTFGEKLAEEIQEEINQEQLVNA